MTDDIPASTYPSRVRARLLDAEVTPLAATDTAALIREHAQTGKGAVVGNLNLHGVYMLHTSEDFRNFYDSCDLVLIDGAPIAWASGVSTKFRVGSTDWLDALMPIAKDLSILAIGGSPETAAGTTSHMRSSFPQTHWVGVDGYKGSQMTTSLRDHIEQAQIVLVGMGMPLQERWLLQHKDLLKGKVVANVGGCLDYYASTQPLAPRWVGRVGGEWLFRLIRDPRRLSNRYLVEPFKLARVLIKNRRR